MSYFKRSVEKFRQDALSKIFYDLIKGLIVTILGVFAIKLIPADTSFGTVLKTPVSMTFYSILLYSLLIVAITVCVVAYLFNKKFQKVRTDNYTDELTGLKNHKALKEHLSEKLNNSKVSGKTFSIIVIDIDDFKKFNTNYNPNFADQVLRKLGELLGNDKRITDETFRQFLRGDEFVIIASETSLNDAVKAAERKRTLIEGTTFIVDNINCNLSVSCGVTEVKKDSDDFKSITDRVNQALKEAKAKAGKNNTKSII